MSRQLPSLRGLAALSALARLGRQEQAAAALGISRSALSHRIAELERELGVALVAKQGRLAVVTEDGQALLSAMGDALERIEAAVAPWQRRRRQIRLSTTSTFASNWLLPRLGDFRACHLDIDLVVTTTQRVVDLEREEVDCAIRHGLGQWDGVRAELLFRETLVPVARPGFWGARAADWPVIRARSRFQDWTRWWRLTGQRGAPRQDGLVVETRAQALEAALAGAGVVLTDRRYLDGPLAEARLAVLGPAVALPEGSYFVRGLRLRNAGPVERMRRWLEAQVAAQGGCAEPVRDGAGFPGSATEGAMPAKSKAQQKAAGAALAAKRGEIGEGELKGAARDMYESMTEAELEEFARTRRAGLPEHVET
ncbi:MAG: DUF3008 family protein [Amaricoccus sp.]